MPRKAKSAKKIKTAGKSWVFRAKLKCVKMQKMAALIIVIFLFSTSLLAQVGSGSGNRCDALKNALSVHNLKFGMTWNEVEHALVGKMYSVSRSKSPFFLEDTELEQIPINKLKKLDPIWKEEILRLGSPDWREETLPDKRIVVDLGIENVEIRNKQTVPDPIKEIDLRFFNRTLYFFRIFYTTPMEGQNKEETFGKVMKLEGLDIDPDCSSFVRALALSVNNGTRIPAFEVEDVSISSQFSAKAGALLRDAIEKHRQETGENLLANIARDEPLQIISKPRPVYTEEARRNDIQGTVELRVTFLASGEIGDISPVKGLEFGLTEKAMESARKIKFRPATKNGVPVTVTKVVTWTFSTF